MGTLGFLGSTRGSGCLWTLSTTGRIAKNVDGEIPPFQMECLVALQNFAQHFQQFGQQVVGEHAHFAKRRGFAFKHQLQTNVITGLGSMLCVHRIDEGR